jgi:hypothetical protein
MRRPRLGLSPKFAVPALGTCFAECRNSPIAALVNKEAARARYWPPRVAIRLALPEAMSTRGKEGEIACAAARLFPSLS